MGYLPVGYQLGCLHGSTIGDPEHEPLLGWVRDILHRHPCWKAFGFGDDIGGKSNVWRFLPASSGVGIAQCAHIGVLYPFLKKDKGIKKRGTVLLSVPRVKALALPNLIEQTTSEPTPI